SKPRAFAKSNAKVHFPFMAILY
ncbi:putative lysine decarboxylase family protein, partial [Vibrio parahaemolyticus V-223/04]